MAKTKMIKTSEFEQLLIERFGNLSAEELSCQMSALESCLDLKPEAKEVTEDCYQLGVKVLDALAAGHAQDYQQAREWVDEQARQPDVVNQEDTTTAQPNNDLPTAITKQGNKLYQKIPKAFARQEEIFGTALDQAVLADLNARIQNGDLDAAIEAELGKDEGEAPPSFVEMLGLGPASSVPTLPESSTE